MTKFELNQLSCDQKYMYKIVEAVTSGTQHKTNLKPGPLSHSKWLTTASRILRFYISTKNPTENLVILTNYVVKVYLPV